MRGYRRLGFAHFTLIHVDLHDNRTVLKNLYDYVAPKRPTTTTVTATRLAVLSAESPNRGRRPWSERRRVGDTVPILAEPGDRLGNAMS